MNKIISNTVYGVLDYVAYPIGMLVVAPLVLRNLGLAEYGVWAVATAAVSTGSILASGFGDANIQYIASRYGTGDEGACLRAVRSTMGIQLILGVLFAGLGFCLSSPIASHVAVTDPLIYKSCLWSLRISSVLVAVRAIESVCISTQRAMERYGAAVRISIQARILSLAMAAGLSVVSHSVVAIMLALALLTAGGTWLQLVELARLLSAKSVGPSFDRDALNALWRFGSFSWMQSASGVVFSQVDRLMLGVSLGATSVASYALCAQMAQPIFGIAASGLHFLFPYLASRQSSTSSASVQRSIIIAFVFNLLFVTITGGTLLIFGDRILALWAGTSVAHAAIPVRSIVIWSSALLGMNVTATYTLMAFGRIQIVTWVNLAGGALMLLLMFALTPRMGIQGIAWARLSYSITPLFLYVPLFAHFLKRSPKPTNESALEPVCEQS